MSQAQVFGPPADIRRIVVPIMVALVNALVPQCQLAAKFVLDSSGAQPDVKKMPEIGPLGAVVCRSATRYTVLRFCSTTSQSTCEFWKSEGRLALRPTLLTFAVDTPQQKSTCIDDLRLIK